jgi:hypothetical protein
MPTQFPTFKGYGWPIIRTPVQSTLVQTSVSGKQFTEALYPWPKWNWKFSFGYLFDDYSNSFGGSVQQFGFQALAGFFNSVSGRAFSWLYLDPFDNTATLQPAGILVNGVWQTTGDGNQLLFQLFKSQQGGPLEPVQEVINIANVYVNGVAKTFGTQWNVISAPPVVINFAVAPPVGQPVTWTGNFYYLCRFLQDKFEFSHDFYGIYSVKDLEFESVFG